MAHKSRVAFGDHQVSLPLLDRKSGSKVWRGRSRCVHHDVRPYLRAIPECDAALSDMPNRNPELKPSSTFLRALRKKAGRARGIQHTILGDQQAALHS